MGFFGKCWGQYKEIGESSQYIEPEFVAFAASIQSLLNTIDHTTTTLMLHMDFINDLLWSIMDRGWFSKEARLAKMVGWWWLDLDFRMFMDF